MKYVFEQLDKTLAGLKDFQRATVDRVIERFNDSDRSERILVADEVGLGKTIVAKGVIAELLRQRIDQSRRPDGSYGVSDAAREPFRVTYICSNLALARENRSKLAVFEKTMAEKYVQEPSFGRLVELAVTEKNAAPGKLLEVCSLTPSTSFVLTKSDGNVWERYIIFQCLMEHARLTPYATVIGRLMRSGVKPEGWNRQAIRFAEDYCLDQALVADYLLTLDAEAAFSEELAVWLDMPGCSWIDALERIGQRLAGRREFASSKTWFSILNTLGGAVAHIESAAFARLRSALRTHLASTCAQRIRADLFILDEFQRFDSLLNVSPDSDSALIAQQVFNRDNPGKILLLSATPFKAMSRIADDEIEVSHQKELRHLLTFLMNSDEEKLSEYEEARKDLLGGILRLRNSSLSVADLSVLEKQRVEKALNSYIARTERSQVGENMASVFKPKVKECLTGFGKNDIHNYKAMIRVADALDGVAGTHHGHQLIEFYKSAPWAMSFLSGYALKERLEHHLKHPVVRAAVKKSSDGWLAKKDVASYALKVAQDAPNAKLKWLMDELFDSRVEELLWIPPSAPHYPLEEAFAGNSEFSKTLLFSSWAMVPRAISGLVSYEMERRLQPRRGPKQPYFTADKDRLSPPIRLTDGSALEGWSLVYPSLVLAECALEHREQTLTEVLEHNRTLLAAKLGALKSYEAANGKNHRHWYAIASMLLDIQGGHGLQLQAWLKAEKDKTQESGRLVHIARLEKLLDSAKEGSLQLGPMPDDLAEHLSFIAVAGPGVCAFRTIATLWPDEADEAAEAGKAGKAMQHASGIAVAVIQMFNKPESVLALRKITGRRKTSPIQTLLKYAAAGGFQAMLDEYGHLLKGSGIAAVDAAKRLSETLGFRTSSVACQFREARLKTASRSSGLQSTLRCHFAVPLGNQQFSDENQARVEHIRDAFNSPFKPFMLNSTSMGQEGLDFHWYCNRVVHWNIPSNPIDIEQREGRVNRYKSLVVRRRVYELVQLQGADDNMANGDYWEALFAQADRLTRNRISDLTPYWHIPEGTAQIERVIPMMPMSLEVGRLVEALKILTLYRLAFGQPRQEELIDNLLKRQFSEEELNRILDAFVINLAPLIQKSRRD